MLFYLLVYIVDASAIDLAWPGYHDFGNGTCSITTNVRETVPVTRKDCRWCRSYTTYTVRIKPKTEEFCCNQYTRTHAGKCVPICYPPCKNSNCVRPGVCECYQNYEHIDSSTCTPKCDPPCIHGWCKEPDHCECFDDYQKNTTHAHECAPVCSGGCGPYGYCTAPNQCTCIRGYVGKRCDKPVCSLECVSSFCSAPDQCSCNDGYVASENTDEWNVCVPYCADFVSNAQCTSPGNWTCLDGHERAGADCLPKCEQECVNGECIAPNMCSCSDGYADISLNGDASNCTPVCSNGCNHGTCVEPEKCLCDDGHSEADGGCSPDCSPTCIGGYCAAPGLCACGEGSLKAYHFVCLATCTSYQNVSIPSNDTSNSTSCYHFTEYELVAVRTEDGSSFEIVEPLTTFYLPCSYHDMPEGSPGILSFQCFTQLLNESLEVVCSTDVLPLISNVSGALNVSNENITALDGVGGFNVATFILMYPEQEAACPAHFCSESNRTLVVDQLSDIMICIDVPRLIENSPTSDQGSKSSASLVFSIIAAILGTAAVVGTYVYFAGRATIYRVNKNLLISEALIPEEVDFNDCTGDIAQPKTSISLNAMHKNTEL